MEDSLNMPNNMFPGLDADTLNALYASEKNWNSEFKSGNLAEGLSGAVSGVGNSMDFAAHIPILSAYVVSYVSGQVLTYVGNATTYMLSIDISKIPTLATSKFTNYLLSTGDIMKELLTPREQINEELNKQTDMKVMSDLNNQLSEKVSYLSNGINKKLEPLKDDINSIATYVHMGPGWVKNKIDIATKKVIESSFKEIASVRDSTKKIIDKTIDNIAEGQAKKLAAKQNDEIKKQCKEKIDKANIAKQKALTKAKTAIINAKLALMAILGG